jgi:Kef-type K+ transport system membrane component KefB
MNQIEVLIILILLIMAVPDISRKLRRPALSYPLFVLFGVLLGPFSADPVEALLIQAGQVGLLLLLFEVGLEIDLPRLRQFWRPLRYALTWSMAQVPFIFLLARLAGLKTPEALLACAVMTGCSVGMSHGCWKHFHEMDGRARPFVLQVMVALEMLAIVAVSLYATLGGEARPLWVPLQLLGIAAIIWAVSRLAVHLRRGFDRILEAATHWRVHLVVLLLLAVCAVGERLGLSAIKTAFFLGLFMSRSSHQGHCIEEAIAPISQRFLIPLLFVSLGLQVGWRRLATPWALLPLGTVLFLLGWREIMHRRWLRSGGGRKTFLLFSPNLTLAALGSTIVLKNPGAGEAASWLLLSGFFMSVLSIALLPPANDCPRAQEPEAGPTKATSASFPSSG